MKEFFTKVKDFFKGAYTKFQEVCTKLDERLPRKSYIFFVAVILIFMALAV